jgi:hypothetical protein
MKKILGLMICGCCALSSNAQDPAPKHWELGITGRGGRLGQDMTMIDFAKNYPEAINIKRGTAKFENGNSYGIDLQLAYYVDKGANFGIGTGIMYLRQAGNITYDNFQVTYKAVDGNGDTYRQMLSTAWPFKEKVQVDNINIPVVLKYRGKISGRSGIAIDAGVLYNLKTTYHYNSKAGFDYEAAYKFVLSNGNPGFVYDNAPVPDPNDWLLTEQAYNQSRSDGNAKGYFASLQDQGYNVGLKEAPKKKTGKSDYTASSIGFIIQPSYTHRIGKHSHLRIGAYYIMQTFDGTDNNAGFKLSDKIGDYSPLVNGVSETKNTSYGVTVGVAFGL